MTLSRRDFIASLAATGLSGSVRPFASAPARPLVGGPEAEAFVFAPLVAGFTRRERARPTKIVATGLARADYLGVIDGIARVFVECQDARGAVIDPFEKTERQYSTPAFALAAGVLCASGRNRSLLAAAIRAMETAAADLAAGRAADGHADFYTVLLGHADKVLGPLAPADAARRWRDSLRAVVPSTIYRVQPSAPAINNWNLVAAAGEWLRTRDGYGSTVEWIEASLARQAVHLTPPGMYRDPNDPMAYDHFARLWLLDLVEEGYRGAHAAPLETLLERAAWMSLFMQSPHGELPCGGRSAHHQWNEAEQAVTFETFARRCQSRGDRVSAGAFKRAARLSLRSMTRWIRPTGELWVVKNRLDPILRHGYETYSFHSQYNLLAAAMLALAWLRADDAIPERACPTDTGGHAFALQPAFHKVFLSAGGYFLQIDAGADPHYNPTGILRVHHAGIPPELLSDGIAADCAYTVPARPGRSIALGPSWMGVDGRWHSLAEHAAADLDPVKVVRLEATPTAADAELEYRGRLRGGVDVVRETIRIDGGGVEIRHEVEGRVSRVREHVPFLTDDGRSASVVRDVGSGMEISRDGGRLTLTGPDGEPRHERVRAAGRNGFMDEIVFETSNNHIGCRLTMAPTERPGSRGARTP
jgi:hypothetical protein